MRHSLGDTNNTDLSLLGDMSTQEIAQTVETAPAEQRAAFYGKVKSQSHALRGGARRSRRAFLERLHLLPKEIQNALAKGSLQAVDMSYYVVKEISGSKQIKMFSDDDKKVVGWSNISSGKLEKGAFFCADSIRLLCGSKISVANVIQQNPFGVNFTDLPEYVINGEFEFKANGTTIIPATSCEMFNTENDSNLVTSTFVLDNPKMLRDQQVIELNIEWGVAAPADRYLKAVIMGTGIVKA